MHVMALRDTPQMTRWGENGKLLSLKKGKFYGSFWAQFPYPSLTDGGSTIAL